MKQDDYFLKQIDILGRVLGKIITDLLQLKSKGQIMDGIEVTSEALKSELDLDINDLLLIPTEKLIDVLQKKNKLNLDHFEKLAEILLLIGDEHKDEKKVQFLQRSLILFNFINNNSSTFSMDRMSKIERIKAVL